MEQYGNGRYVIDSACRAGAVAVEKSRTRLRVMEKLSVRFCPPPTGLFLLISLAALLENGSSCNYSRDAAPWRPAAAAMAL